jgi:uncharacterized membrane protein YkoI
MNPIRKALLGGAVLASTIGGGVVGAAFLNGTATAADTTSTTAAAAAAAPTTAQAPPAGNLDPSKGGHTANGITETLLTGDDASKATAAALAAVPGATVQRVETDAEGATYEAHLKKADGTLVTVKLDSSFKVTSTEDGMR